MNNEQIFAIISQGLNKATKSGNFDLKEADVIIAAIKELQKALNIEVPAAKAE
jgi:hypothetical protein